MKPDHETKEERFVRVADARVNKILSMVRLLGNLANTAVYSYTQEQSEKIFLTIQESLNAAKLRFSQQASEKKKRFSLDNASKEAPHQEEHPTITLALPDGSVLRAVAFSDDLFPAINIYWERDGMPDKEQICFAEYNSEKGPGACVYVAAYQSNSDETKYYAPYIGRKEME